MKAFHGGDTRITERVAMIGSGVIGRAFAVCFPRGGYEVTRYVPVEGVAACALPRIRKIAVFCKMCGRLTGAHLAEVLDRVSAVRTMEEAVDSAVNVQENATGTLEGTSKNCVCFDGGVDIGSV